MHLCILRYQGNQSHFYNSNILRKASIGKRTDDAEIKPSPLDPIQEDEIPDWLVAFTKAPLCNVI